MVFPHASLLGNFIDEVAPLASNRITLKTTADRMLQQVLNVVSSQESWTYLKRELGQKHVIGNEAQGQQRQ